MNEPKPNLSRSSDVMVSVLMITYNHEPFIAQAIESVLMQETDFQIELVIGEDCSTDGTRSIVLEYAERHPDIIRPLLPDHNLGMIPNFVGTMNACQGRYIALLEGDDYWTDPHKLQKQVDFLEAHPDYAICFHDVLKVYEDQRREPHPYCSPHQKKTATLTDLLISNFIPTCSVMFRQGLFGELPQWFFQVAMGDRAIHILNAQHGHISYLNESMGVYRIHKTSIWSSKDVHLQVKDGLKFYGYLLNYLAPNHHPAIFQGIALRIRWLLPYYLDLCLVHDESPRRVKMALEQFFDECPWPAVPGLKSQQTNQFYSQFFAALLFKSQNLKKTPVTRYALRQIFRYNSGLFRNLGVWSITAEALLGASVTAHIRQAARQLMTLC